MPSSLIKKKLLTNYLLKLHHKFRITTKSSRSLGLLVEVKENLMKVVELGNSNNTSLSFNPNIVRSKRLAILLRTDKSTR
jgi:hypothetical protein